MSPRSRPGSVMPATPVRVSRTGPQRFRVAALLAVVVAFVAVLSAACSPAFDPSGPCTQDGRKAGAYPELEAVVPKDWQGNPPSEVDSGRTCSKDGLGTLAGHGVTELRYAGATWATANQSGLTLAVFMSAAGAPLDPAWLAEFYETSARAGKNVESVDGSDMPVAGGQTARRIDVLNNESYQTVVVWSDGDRVLAALVGDNIRVVNTKDAHEKVVEAAVETLAKASQGR